MSRVIDRGAQVAALVGVGMAAVVVVSFVLVVPIPVVGWLLMPLGGVIIGYYADSRADRRAGPWWRILVDGAWAALVTGLAFAVLSLAITAIFFFADDGYRGDAFGGRLDCQPGPACVYARYVAQNGADALRASGITDVATFSAAYWQQQVLTDGSVAGLTLAGGVIGAILFGLARPRERRELPGGVGTAASP